MREFMTHLSSAKWREAGEISTGQSGSIPGGDTDPERRIAATRYWTSFLPMSASATFATAVIDSQDDSGLAYTQHAPTAINSVA